MKQQEINNQILHQQQPQPIAQFPSSIHSQHQPNLIYANKRYKQISKLYLINFRPFKKYFRSQNHKPNIVSLYQANPSFYSQSNLYDRSRLSVQRQSMYYRAAVDEYFYEQLMNDFLKQNSTDKGFINKKRNKSIIIDNQLIYTHQQKLYAIQLPKFCENYIVQVPNSSTHPLQLYSFQQGEDILELQKLTNCGALQINDTALVLRFSRKVCIYSLSQMRVIHTFRSSSQVVSFFTSLYRKDSFQIVEYDGISSVFSSFRVLDGNIQRTPFSSFKTMNLAVSNFNLTQNEVLIAKYENLTIYDRRIGKQNIVFSVQSIHKERIYESIPLKGLYNFSPYVLVSQTRYVSIFDIRNPKQAVQKMLHQCEEAPPQILQFWDGGSRNKLIEPILALTSPYSLGSSIFTSINLQKLRFKQKFDTGLSPFSLLNDRNKHQQSNYATFNQSISMSNPNDSQLIFYQIDNMGNISMQFFNFDKQNKQYKGTSLNVKQNKMQKMNENNLLTNKNCYSIELFKHNEFSKYFTEEYTYKTNENQMRQNENIKLTKKSSKKQAKKNKNCHKNKNVKKCKPNETQIQEIQIQNAYYQNSQDCELHFSKRKLNYVELHNFYSTLQQKAVDIKLQCLPSPDQQQTQIKFTQPTLSQSLSQNEKNHTNILFFHNKKVMNWQILQKLKNQWKN